MRILETPMQFGCRNEQLFGVLHQAFDNPRRALLMVSGNHSYRVGPHRMFVLLARSWAQLGVSVMRFDCRGIGDSSGDLRPLEETCEDIEAAMNCLVRSIPDLEKIVIWSFCGVTSPALNHFLQNESVGGIVMVNPWMPRQITLNHSTEIDGRLRSTAPINQPGQVFNNQNCTWRGSNGQALIILSGDDFSLSTFETGFRSSAPGQVILNSPRLKRHYFPGADHFFTERAWLDRMANQVYEWIQTL